METNLTIWLVFLAGITSFLSPCVLPLVPGYLGMVTGIPAAALQEESGLARHRRRMIVSMLAFVLGFSVVFIAMGAAATLLGQLLQSHRIILQRIAGVIILIFGFHLLGIFRLTALYRERRFHLAGRGGPVGAFLIGMAFAFGWTPCVGPILGSVLLLASATESVGRGMALLAVYSLGLGLPFLATGLAAGSLVPLLRRIKGGMAAVEAVSGLILITFGILIFFDKLSLLSGRLGFLAGFSQ